MKSKDRFRTLSEHLKHKGVAMKAAAQRRPTVTDWQESISAECVADDLTGVRKLRIREFNFVSDGGPEIGGWDLGPTSPELLCGVGSTCLTYTYLCIAAMRELSLEKVSVRVTAENNDAHFFDVPSDVPIVPHELTAHVSIESQSLNAAEIDAFIHEGEQRCPIASLIRNPNTIHVLRTGPDGSVE